MTIRPVNEEYLRELEARLNHEERQVEESEPALKGGRGGGTSGGMEERVTRLETHFEYVRRDLDDIRGTQSKILDIVIAQPTRSDLNTWRWQWIATGIAIVALTIGGITGGLALIARFAG